MCSIRSQWRWITARARICRHGSLTRTTTTCVSMFLRTDPFSWKGNQISNEILVSIEEKGLQFVLSLKRNPFEIRLHLRTRDRDIGLVRLDNSPYHPNPDGTEIVDQPHLHLYREGQD